MENDPKKLLESMQQYKPIPWDRIPDLGLYMDQVITLITRMYEPLYGPAAAEYLSSSMINNYVKSKLIPRPVGKKYGREQIALLCMIVALKQVSSMEDIRSMLSPENGLSVEEMYNKFCICQQMVISSLKLPDEIAPSELPLTMAMAIVSSGYRAGFEVLIRANTPKPTETK